MIPATFEYERVDSVDAALAALAEHGDDAKLLAGGHSLLPLMKLRLATARGADRHRSHRATSSGIRDGGDHVAIGALTRHHDVEHSDLLARAGPDPAARPPPGRRPAGPPPGHDRRLDRPRRPGVGPARRPARPRAHARRALAGPRRADDRGIDDFFTGFLETASQPDELLTEIRVPKIPGAGWSFQKFNRRAQDWAIVGVRVRAQRLRRGRPGEHGIDAAAGCRSGGGVRRRCRRRLRRGPRRGRGRAPGRPQRQHRVPDATWPRCSSAEPWTRPAADRPPRAAFGNVRGLQTTSVSRSAAAR